MHFLLFFNGAEAETEIPETHPEPVISGGFWGPPATPIWPYTKPAVRVSLDGYHAGGNWSTGEIRARVEASGAHNGNARTIGDTLARLTIAGAHAGRVSTIAAINAPTPLTIAHRNREREESMILLAILSKRPRR